MTHPEHDDVPAEVAPRRPAWRTKALVGVGLAALLGGGAVLATQNSTVRNSADDATTAQETQRTTTLAEETTGPAAVSESPTPASKAPAAKAPDAAAAAAPPAKSREQQIEEAKGSAAKVAGKVERPVGSASVNDADVKVTEVASADDKGGSLKVMSAKEDLTGKRELAWVLGQTGEKVGDARCSQKISLATGVPAKERKTLLLCWRVSAEKSVYTLAVDPDGPPSKVRSTKELEKAWNAL